MKTKLFSQPGWDGWCFLHQAPRRGENKPPRRIHTHDELELNIGVSGKGRYLIDGRTVDVGPGTVVLLSPEQAHLLIQESPDFAMWVAVIHAGAAPPAAPDHGFCIQSSPEDAIFITELCRQLAVLCTQLNDPLKAVQFNAGARFLFARADELAEQTVQGDLMAMHPAVIRASRFMNRPEQTPDVDEISRHAGMSRSQLSRLFKKQTGLTLVEYRQSIQLERFLFLYGAGINRNLTEAALKAGFGSYIQFYRVFQRRFRCGPRDYFGTANPASL